MEQVESCREMGITIHAVACSGLQERHVWQKIASETWVSFFVFCFLFFVFCFCFVFQKKNQLKQQTNIFFFFETFLFLIENKNKNQGQFFDVSNVSTLPSLITGVAECDLDKQRILNLVTNEIESNYVLLTSFGDEEERASFVLDRMMKKNIKTRTKNGKADGDVRFF